MYMVYDVLTLLMHSYTTDIARKFDDVALFEIMTHFFSCKTLEFLWLTIFTVVTMILSSATLGALLSTLGHFLHAEVSDNRTRYRI